MNDHALCHWFCENRFTESKLRRMSVQSRYCSQVKSRILLRFALKKSRRKSIGCGVMNCVWPCSSFYPQSPSEATWGAGRSMNRHCDWQGGHKPIFYLLKNTHIQPFDIHPPDQTPQDRIWIPDLEIQNWNILDSRKLKRKSPGYWEPEYRISKFDLQIQG